MVRKSTLSLDRPGVFPILLEECTASGGAMFTVNEIEGTIPTVALIDSRARSRALIAPGRGGMVTSFEVAGREVFYLDRKTFEDPAANVRGGNPVLFPSPGRLAGDAFSWRGAAGSMKQHGFARNLPWTPCLRGSGSPDGAYLGLMLASDDRTRAQFPWDFHAEITYSLRGAALRIDLRVSNQSAGDMPFGAGFHPYFAVPDADKGRVELPTGATRAFDNTTKTEVPFAGFDLTLPEVDLHLLDHGASAGELWIDGGDGRRVSLRGSPEFSHWVVWTLKGKDFVCLEPWTCPGNALNTQDRLIVLGPGESRALWLEISAG